MTRGYLALDQGGHASRAFLFDAHGALAASAEVPIATRRIGNDRVEHDAAEVCESVRAAALKACADAPNVVPGVAALATQRSSIVCFDREGAAPLSPVLSWQDRRAAALLATLDSSAARVTSITGLPLSAHYGASKMRWCLDELPLVRNAADRGRLAIGPLSSFLAARLCGDEPCVDPANASRTLLWDIGARDWSDELLSLFQIEQAWLPRCVPTRADFGVLSLDALRVPLQLVTGDQSAVPFAFGAPQTEDLFLNLGTGAFLQRYVGDRPVTAAPLLASVLGSEAQSAWFSVEGTVNGAGSAIDAFGVARALDPARLWVELADGGAPPDAPLPLYLNAVGGLGSPYWASRLESRFVGGGSPLEEFAAIAESIVFLIRVNFEHLASFRPAIERVVATGGLARSDWLCERLASILGIDVLRPAASEATVHGLLGLMRGDAVAHESGAGRYREARRFHRPPSQALERRYRDWRAALEAALAVR